MIRWYDVFTTIGHFRGMSTWNAFRNTLSTELMNLDDANFRQELLRVLHIETLAL